MKFIFDNACLLCFSQKVINSSATDEFLSVSNTAVFVEGAVSTVGTLILINDAIPEGNETFVVEIIDARFGAELGSLTTLLLTVEASDEPYGRISFDDVSKCTNMMICASVVIMCFVLLYVLCVGICALCSQTLSVYYRTHSPLLTLSHCQVNQILSSFKSTEDLVSLVK